MRDPFYKLMRVATISFYNNIMGTNHTYNQKDNKIVMYKTQYEATEKLRQELLLEAVDAFNASLEPFPKVAN